MAKVAKPRADNAVRTPSKSKPVKTPQTPSTDDDMPKAAKPKTKARGEKKKKDPNAPKRGLSAYMFYANENRERVRSENPNISFGQVGKVLGEEWKSLTDEKKKKYVKLAEDDKVRYEKEKAKYNAGEDEDDDGSD